MAALIAVIGPIGHEVKSALTSVFDGGGPSPWTSLEIERPVTLVDGGSQQAEVAGRSVWKRRTVPQVDFTVRNDGDDRVPLNRVKVEVIDSDRLTSCEAPQGGGGSIPVSESFLVSLPLYPSADEKVVYRRLHQEVLPHRATRLKVRFQTLASFIAAEEFADELYAVRVTLLGDEEGTDLPVGSFVLSLPGALPRNTAYLPESTKALREAAALHVRLASTWCFRRNLSVIRKFTTIRGQRSQATLALADLKSPADWARFADHRSAAAAVGPLLHDRRGRDQFMEPLLALYAARTSGSKELTARVRSHAVTVLRDWVKAAIENGPPIEPSAIVIDARVLAKLAPGDSSTLLLERAEAELHQAETAAKQSRG